MNVPEVCAFRDWGFIVLWAFSVAGAIVVLPSWGSTEADY